MAYFPGNIMVIDDQFPLLYKDRPQKREEQIQYDSLLDVKNYCENVGIPFIVISDTDDAESVEKRIKLYDNIRMLIIDLDLNNDGEVGVEDDYETIFLILRTAIKKFGYFLLLINSAHEDAWNSIKNVLPSDIDKELIENITFTFDKKSNEKAYHALEKIGENYNLELIYHFESELNLARDKAFHDFLSFKGKSWEKLIDNLNQETGELANNDVTGILLGRLKQYLVDVSYHRLKVESTDVVDSDLKKKIFSTIYYTKAGETINKQKVWTGNIYETNLGDDRKFALVINPECDIAQNKHLYTKIVFGFEVNESTFPGSYNNENYKDNETPPILPFRAGKIKGKQWQTKSNLAGNVKSFKPLNESMYSIPYLVDNLIYLDFRDVSSVEETTLKNWNLVARINEPMITDILDRYSNLHNRKGLLPILK